MSIYTRITELQAAGEPFALCTVVRASGSVPRQPGAKMLVHPDGRIEGTIGGGAMESRVIEEALAALADGQPRIREYSLAGDAQRGDPGICGGNLEVFIEPNQPQPALLIIGAGHVGRAMAKFGKLLGYRILVSDDRPELCNHVTIPEADAFYPMPMAELPTKLTFNPQTFVVLTTRNAEVDIHGLPALMDQPSGYLGVIGSRKRWAEARKKLEAAGISAARLDSVRSPMGLEIHAETPEEIALSILAEITMLRRGGDGSVMSSK
jgi:xanthine dehydrogenase accessory factor